MALQIRGPYHNPGTSWDVYRDGKAVPGYIALAGDRYLVDLGGMRGAPWPSFATLEEAAQALADYHAGQPPPT
jgi:hypothetical protein